MQSSAKSRNGSQRLRIVVVGDTCISEAGMTTIVEPDKRYYVCGGAHGFFDADELIRRHRPDILLIEPFLGDRDGILWIKELAREYPQTRILIVSRQSERVYAERALHAGAAGYWMANGSAEELMHAIETVGSGKIYASPDVTALAMERFARRGNLPKGIDALSDREIAVFSLVAVGRRPGEIAERLGISRKTIETHCEHIKQKLRYADAEELKSGARELFGMNKVNGRCVHR